MKKTKYKTRIFEAVHETDRYLRFLGFINKKTLKAYDTLCFEPARQNDSEQKTKPRLRYKIS